mmetsp:Transcript_7113/g.10820  ORF Transcript_7113/g.10820 Transcript_7113/m.10820 type:complete len:204 (+) Transcript_7113:537-1148(+)
MKPGLALRRAPLRAFSFNKALTLPSSTLGRMKFCSTVKRISPPEYASARSAISRHSVADKRPEGTSTPTRDFPSCGCLWTPISSRRSKGSVGRGWASDTVTPRSYELISLITACLNSATPYFSTSHIRRAFWRSLRSLSSRKMRRMASERVTTDSRSAGIHMSAGILSATRLMDMYPPSTKLKPITPVSACLQGTRPMSLMWV